MAVPSVMRACALAAALAIMADASPLALFTCSIRIASEARILLCRRPSARLMADSLTPKMSRKAPKYNKQINGSRMDKLLLL